MIIRTGDRGTSRFSRMEISVHAQVLRPRGVRWRLAHNATSDVAFHRFDSVGTPISLISRLNSPAYTYHGPGKVAFWGVSRDDTPMMG